MKPTSLRHGDRLRYTRGLSPDRIYVFLRRTPRLLNQPAVSLLHCPDYVGLNGPDDRGLITVSDYELSHNFARVAA